jgi:hypothetical protein
VLGDIGGAPPYSPPSARPWISRIAISAIGATTPASHRREGDRRESREAHKEHRDEEGVLATPEIAQPSEDQRPERSHRQARGEGEEREDVAGGLVDAGKEVPVMKVASEP